MSNSESTKTSTKKQAKNKLISPLKEALTSLTKSYKFFLPNNQDVISIVIELSPQTELREAIKKVLKQASKEYPVDQNPLNYDAYQAKKNGQPKIDYSSYLPSLILENTENFSFSLVHTAFAESKQIRKSQRKSTYDLSNVSPTKSTKSKEIAQLNTKPEKHWLLRFLGCA